MWKTLELIGHALNTHIVGSVSVGSVLSVIATAVGIMLLSRASGRLPMVFGGGLLLAIAAGYWIGMYGIRRAESGRK